MSFLVYWIPDYADLGAKICASIQGGAGALETKKFGDGERYFRLLSKVRDQDVILVGGTISDKATMDLFDLACGLVGNGCRSLKILIPFYGYSTMERAIREGEVVTAKTRARILSAIPIAPFGNQVVMLDLHTEGIPFYFEGPVKTYHLYAKALILKEARRQGGDQSGGKSGAQFILGAPDAGRAKWVESLANDLSLPAGFVYKRRAEDGSVSISGVNVSVKNSHVVIYDDMIRSGKSILQAARAYKAAGAKAISLITTHGLFTENALQLLKSSGIISEITCTDSHPNALTLQDPFVRVLSTAEVFANYLLEAREAAASDLGVLP